MQPLYIAAERGQLPELKRVIVGFGDRIAMEETLDGAGTGVRREVPACGGRASPGPRRGPRRR